MKNDQGAIDPAQATEEQANELLALMLEQSSDLCIVLTRPDGEIVGWRGAAARLFGWTEKEAIGQPIDMLFTAEDRSLGIPALERTVAGGDGRAEDDRWHVRKDGGRAWISGAMVPVRKGDRLVGFAKIMRDRTDLRAQIETLQSRVNSTQTRLDDRDAFIARLTHEIRNALGPMSLATEVLAQAQTLEQMKFPREVIARQLDLARRMINDLEDAARFGIGKLRLSLSEFDIVADVTQVADAIRPRADARHQRLLVYSPEPAVKVKADRERVHQIAFNLLDNAIKYTPEGGSIWLKITVEEDGFVFRVEDNGIGITPTLLPKIFELFTQGEQTGSMGGLGVGLSLVKDLVEAHGGSVEARSNGRDKGAEFTVRLPLGGPRTTAEIDLNEILTDPTPLARQVQWPHSPSSQQPRPLPETPEAPEAPPPTLPETPT